MSLSAFRYGCATKPSMTRPQSHSTSLAKCVDDADVLFGIAKSTTPYDACETIEFEILKYTVNIVKLSEYISYTSLIVAFSNEL